MSSLVKNCMDENSPRIRRQHGLDFMEVLTHRRVQEIAHQDRWLRERTASESS